MWKYNLCFILKEEGNVIDWVYIYGFFKLICFDGVFVIDLDFVGVNFSWLLVILCINLYIINDFFIICWGFNIFKYIIVIYEIYEN